MSLVKSVLAEIDDKLGLDSYYKWLNEEVEIGPQLLSREAKELWTRVLESANQDIQYKKRPNYQTSFRTSKKKYLKIFCFLHVNF